MIFPFSSLELAVLAAELAVRTELALPDQKTAWHLASTVHPKRLNKLSRLPASDGHLNSLVAQGRLSRS